MDVGRGAGGAVWRIGHFIQEIRQVPGLRAASVGIPPLLADIIRKALTSRVDVDVMVEIAMSPHLIEHLKAFDPDVVVIACGPDGDTNLATKVAAALMHAKVIIVSEDARYILNAGDECEFTADALADLLI
jgi:hypothetical protein